ncbi:MAG TPA: type I DNA topoisomerase [Chloroflexia bacterium]|nr:type I DNA topoisomerase [Chloroflexia bacterium]
MAARLVIVESPAKAKTIGKYLGKGYTVRASYGHVRDLPKSKLGVDTEHAFTPQYLIPRDKKEVVKDLKQEVKSADEILLATDPDREGEAIAWHLVSATGIEGTNKKVKRIVFHEITKDAIKDAVKHPRNIDMNLVNAQQARRILDRLVGYKISPILWKKVKRGLSAGRVQSVALRLIVDREREVERFDPVEYWTIEAEFQLPGEHRKSKKPLVFQANLNSVNGKKVELKNEAETQAVLKALEGANYIVSEVRQTKSQRKPAPPFTTSTLQQEASRKLNYTSRRTMSVAQQLYEGVELGKEGSQGLITYMRTDSTNVAAVAQEEARQLIGARYGADYVPETPPVYTKKSKNAQEAHEAVRPTSVLRDPESIKDYLSAEQYKLYRLIWQRFVASQMAPAQLDNTSVDIKAGQPGEALDDRAYLFRATGSVITFPGFLAVYQEGVDDDTEDELSKKALPPLKAEDLLELLQLLPEQHFTQPPPRYTEATLVKTLEELGIGRPSTYAPTLGTIQERYYVVKEEKKFVPTELGVLVNDLVVEFFPEIVDTSFTSNMENELDDIADGERNWVPVLAEFYDPFKGSVEKAEIEMQKVSLEPELAGEDCEKCGRPMYIKMGRFGRFIACSGFPECRNAKPILKKIGMICPKCNEGEVVMRKTKRRRVFYGCSRYPECDFSVWERPIIEPCPVCSGLMTLSGKRNAKCTVCGHTMPYELPDSDEQESGTGRPAPVAAPRSTLSQAGNDTITNEDLQSEQEENDSSEEEEQEERQAAAV